MDERGQRWIDVFHEAWETADIDLLLGPVAERSSFLYPLMEGEVDREGLRDFFKGSLAMMPDFRITPRTWAQRGDDVLIVWEGRATVNGQPHVWEGADWFTLDEEGRVVRGRAYWDPRELLAKFGMG